MTSMSKGDKNPCSYGAYILGQMEDKMKIVSKYVGF
jgi:hypothetical protein